MKPYLDTWRFLDDPGGGYVVNGDQDIPVLVTSGPHGTWQHAELAAAAPDMLRALLVCEKKLDAVQEDPCAPAANYELFMIDEALTKAGLKTKEERDQARKALGIE